MYFIVLEIDIPEQLCDIFQVEIHEHEKTNICSLREFGNDNFNDHGLRSTN